jgi:DNA-binding MarR family transcriptional regulator
VAKRRKHDETPWLDEKQIADWASLMGMLTMLPAALDAQLKRDAGLNTFEYHVLVQLAEAPDRRLPMSALAFAAQGSPSRLSHAVRRLENSGWVERVTSAEERHRVDARLTDAGWNKLVATAPGHVREARRLVVDALSPHQLVSLGEAARSVLAVIDPSTAPVAPAQQTDASRPSADTEA